jgi:hypothetical protein
LGFAVSCGIDRRPWRLEHQVGASACEAERRNVAAADDRDQLDLAVAERNCRARLPPYLLCFATDFSGSQEMLLHVQSFNPWVDALAVHAVMNEL